MSKRKAIKRDIKQKYGVEVAERVSKNISKAIAELKEFPEIGVSMREKYDLDCDYYILFIEHNYLSYFGWDDFGIGSLSWERRLYVSDVWYCYNKSGFNWLLGRRII